MVGKSAKDQVDWLKTEFSHVLLGDEYAEREYNARLEALLELLRARGSQPSASAQKLFSAPSSQEPSSQEASPD